MENKYISRSVFEKGIQEENIFIFQNRVIIEHIFCYNNIYTRKTESEASSGHE